MQAKDIFVSLLNYNDAANDHILKRMGALSPEALWASADLSYSSLFELARHVADAEWSWRRVVRGEPAQQLLWEVEDVSDVPSLRRFLAGEHTRTLAYLSALTDDALDRDVVLGSAPDQTARTVKVWQILLHHLNHSTHHRVELSRRLAELGQPVDEHDLDYLDFALQSGT